MSNQSDFTRPVTQRSTLRQFFVVFTGTVLALLVVVKTQLFEEISYSVEKGRLRAIAETIPTEEVALRRNQDNRVIADLVRPAVVHISSRRTMSFGDNESLASLHSFLRGEADEPDGEDAGEMLDRDLSVRSFQIGMGSGFIFDAEKGLVLTNHHVISEADRIVVRLSDGREVDAEVVSDDIETDVALLRIPPRRLHSVKMMDSGDVRVGDEVFAMGSPFGLDGTFSRGIVSGLGRRTELGSTNYQGFIQTDAVINPGNSGGPLVNNRGEVIGINTAIATESGTFSGVGFAIPARHVLDLLPSLVNGERVVRSFLGVAAFGVHDDRALADELGWTDDEGVVVKHVVEGTPADTAGLQENDIIVELDGRRMTNGETFRHNVAIVGVGRAVPLVYFRDGELIETEVRLVRRPQDR